jgi:hypothetical protein
MLDRRSMLLMAAWLAGCASSTAVAVHPVLTPKISKPTVAMLEPRRAPAPAASVTEPVSPAGSSPLGAAWGTANPVAFVAAAQDRRWISMCQARADSNGDGRVSVEVGAQGELKGDRLDGYFLDQPGAGVRIDSFGGADPSGRFVAFVANDRLVLRDTVLGKEAELGGADVDLRDDRGSFLRPRAVAFDPTGRRVLYLRKNGPGNDVVVRELASGNEAVVSSGTGELWRADFDASGEWVVLRVVTTDTNGNGRLDWPVPAAGGPWMRCAGPLPRYAAYERPGDDTTPRLSRATGGAAIDAPGLLVPFGDSLIARDSEGAIVVAKPSGERTTVLKKSCAAKLLHADSTRGLVIATCDNKKGRADVRFIARGVDKPLGLELLGPSSDRWGPAATRLLPLYPGADSVLVDLDGGQTIPLLPGDRVLTTLDDRALILRGRSVILYQKGAADRVLSTEVDPLAHVLRSDPVIAVPPIVVDVAKGAVLGRVEGRGLAVAQDGAVLVAGAAADATRFAIGPLVWRKSD